MSGATGDVDFLRRIEDKTLNDQNLARDAHVLEAFTARDSEVRTFLKDRCVLITGGTGFLGKVLLEKLLRTCPEIRAVFLLMRKKDKDLETRLNDILENPVFQVLKVERPDFRRQIVLIEGDTEQLGLGLDEEDRFRIQDQVSVIFHAAATVRFDEKLRKAVRVNVRGTGEALKLARGCARLAAFVHFSTAFSHCVRDEIDEVFYPPPMQPGQLIDLVENTSDTELEEMTPKLLGKFPNTYSFSKAVAEDEIRVHGRGLPICVCRPSIVIPTYRQPIKGWTDNLYGPAGIVVGAGIGLIRTAYCDPDIVADIVPVDMVANFAIACAWRTAREGVQPAEPTVYNYVSGSQKPITWGEFCEISREIGITVPTIRAMWYYYFHLNKNWYIHWLYVLLLHYLPAILVDGARCFIGRKPRAMKIYRKIQGLNDALAFFSMRDFKFSNNNVQALWPTLNTADQQLFNFDMEQLNWRQHALTCIMGLRVYLVKDPASTLPQARVRYQRLKMLHRAVQVFVVFLGLFLFTKISLHLYKWLCNFLET